MQISVVIPVYGSEKIIPTLYMRLNEVLKKNYHSFEIIFVDDCGPGDSWDVIQKICDSDENVKGVQLMRNSGQGSATLCGISVSEGDYIVTMDDDLQHPPEEIPKLVDVVLKSDNLDVVIGTPIVKKHNYIRRVGSNFINNMNSKFLEKDPNLRFTGFRVLTKSVGKQLITILTPYPALGPMILSVTKRIESVPFEHKERELGKSNYSFGKILQQTLSNFIGYSMLPLRILAIIGAIGIVISVLLGIYFFSRYLIVGIKTTGWTSLLLLLVSISGFNFFAFALIGEYVLRIMQISTSTPQFSIRKVKNFNK